jgi:hypothetical protein
MPKRKLSPEGRLAIVEVPKRRWAAKRAKEATTGNAQAKRAIA